MSIAIAAAHVAVLCTGTASATLFDQSQFEKDGFALLPGFVSEAEAAEMVAEMAALIDAWDPETSKHSIFHVNNDADGGTDGGTDGDGAATASAALQRDSYFVASADTVSFFLEPSAVNGRTGEIDPGIPKGELLNKVGHGLHIHSPVFKGYAESEKVAEVARQLGYRRPVLPQSMYIFKQPRIGEEVSSHQDATFLFTEPRTSCHGLWLALDAATAENGCLWVRPGSHSEGLRKVWRRNPEWFSRRAANQSLAGVPQMRFEDRSLGLSPAQELAAAGEALDADALLAAGYVRVEAARGELVVIHGELDHLSLPNTSPHRRHTFQLHFVESAGGVRWPETNWQQYPGGPGTFPRLNAAVFDYGAGSGREEL